MRCSVTGLDMPECGCSSCTAEKTVQRIDPGPARPIWRCEDCGNWEPRHPRQVNGVVCEWCEELMRPAFRQAPTKEN